MAQRFQVCFTNGSQLEVQCSEGDTVQQLRESIEEKHEIPEATNLKLIQGARVLLDDVAVSELIANQPVMAIVTRETRLDVLLHASSSAGLYKEVLAAASSTDAAPDSLTTPPFPTILEVLEDMSGQTPNMEHLKPDESPGLLLYSGREGDLLLPSLDLSQLCCAGGKARPAQSVSLTIGVNSDAYNRGLGVVLEASPLVELPKDFKELPVCFYNGYGLQEEGRRRNAVKFHPDMGGGELRIEGSGGFDNQDIGFTPRGWSRSGNKLHTLELTLRTSGDNTLSFQGTEEGQQWQRGFKNVLFDGTHAPALYAWLDLGGLGPVHLSRITMAVNFA